jgi:hypothetical protein
METEIQNDACPETVDLFDHLQGQDLPGLAPHLGACARCRTVLDELKLGLAVEARAFAPPSELEVERALERVRARGQARVRRPWRTTAMAFAAAAVALAMLLPRAFVAPECGKPAGAAPAPAAAPLIPSPDIEVSRGLKGEIGLTESFCAPVASCVPARAAAKVTSAR